ncbi:MAG: hypothetical protein M0Z36_07215 [Thermaerobacter sp.]|nr:hypothetical protein [Thermaerobacter sp.]
MNWHVLALVAKFGDFVAGAVLLWGGLVMPYLDRKHARIKKGD